ncbi:hypothetical protein [Streptomyces sp. XY66]|uniref:hypothetical protein n=1 Tax=Streptomyces sp. XY66 TaxID=1415563 RepID=UPI0006AE960F|nr:hypothetical protein [Streptomyces sp. XY66]
MCTCGWRGAAEYQLGWDTIGDQPLYEADVDLAGPLADWKAHLSVICEAAVPLPERLAALLVEMAEQLTATAADAPLAGLRAAGVPERIAARVGREAASALSDDGISAEAVATALGTTRFKAQILLLIARDGERHAPQLRSRSWLAARHPDGEGRGRVGHERGRSPPHVQSYLHQRVRQTVGGGARTRGAGNRVRRPASPAKAPRRPGGLFQRLDAR